MADAYLTGMSAMAPGVCQDWYRGLPFWPATLPARPDLAAVSPDWFDARTHLSGIKHRYLNGTTCYSLAAVRRCLDQGGHQLWHGTAEERRGILLGTAVADYTVRHGADKQILVGGASALNTIAAPNISANIAAAHVAIQCHSRAFSTTLTSPFLAGFEGLFLGIQSLSRGQAEAVLAVVAEEALPDHETVPVVPGAIASHLQRRPVRGAIRVETLAWGHYPEGGGLAFRGPASGWPRGFPDAARVVLVRDNSAQAAATAAAWAKALAREGFPSEGTVSVVQEGPGALEPLLRVSPWLTGKEPVLLLALHRRRYLAFLLTH